MLKTVKQACEFNPIIRDYRMSEGVEKLSDIISGEGDGRKFFERNYVTQGMDQLFREGMLRLSGISDQAVFELTQAMGGGKTHMMIALGLLAKHPHLRAEVLPADLAPRIDSAEFRVASFNGREKPENFIWGEIATQLGEAEAIRPYWANGPKSVDQSTWKKIIGDKPTLIMIDELPPYLYDASTCVIGEGTLATLVTYSLSCLLSAALELPKCCVVIANLSNSYQNQTRALSEAISNLQQETHRQAAIITPVQLAGNEIYEILKKRLIVKLPNEDIINEVAEEYAQRIKLASDGGYITATSLEQVTDQVRETYPFHPSFKHVVALFKENEGFRQTRGLMQFTARLLKSIADRETDDVFLIGTQHLNLNDEAVRDELNRIAPALQTAVVRDIADNGNATAEKINDQLSSDAATQVSTLLLASSLSRSVGGRVGLTEGEIIEFLAAPNRKPDEFKIALEKFRQQAWHLHREDQRFYIKETENLYHQIIRTAKDIPQPKVDQALIYKLEAILQPHNKAAYQIVQVMPKIADLKLSGPRTLIVVRPDGKLPMEELNSFYDYLQEKNNLLVLTCQDSYLADNVEDLLRSLCAIEQICKRLKVGDTLYEEACEKQEDYSQRFNKALSGAYNRLYFPGVDTTDNKERLLMATIDNGLMIGDGENSAERQIENLLSSGRANYKLIIDLKKDIAAYWAMAESELWPEHDRRLPWKDVTMRAKNNAGWPWMPGNSGMETLKAEALSQGRWRQGADSYIEKGPFPKDKTSVSIIPQSVNAETGESILTLMPRNCGKSPVVFYSSTASVSVSDSKVEDLDNFSTKSATLYFLAMDSDGQHEIGDSQRWVADLKIQHQVKPLADKRLVELRCIPDAKMTYTLDGTNPKEGNPYDQPFEIDSDAAKLLVHALSGEATKDASFQIPAAGDKKVQIDDSKPAMLAESKRVILENTETVFQVINQFRNITATKFKGIRIQIGEGENSVLIRFGQREISAAMIESAINSLRQILSENQANVSVIIDNGASFETGFDIKEFSKLSGIELKPGDVIQED